MQTQIKGPEKAAVFLLSLGEAVAAKILAEMDQNEIQLIGKKMSALGEVDPKTLEQINREFIEKSQNSQEAWLGKGSEFLKAALKKTLNPDKVAEVLDNISAPGEESGGGLETLQSMEPPQIAAFLIGEHPQTAAIVMTYLEPAVAGQVLRDLPEDRRLDIVKRVASLEKVSPQALKELDETLRDEFRAAGIASGNVLGGKATASRILGGLDRQTEIALLAQLEETDPAMAEDIRNLRFTFEDIIKIDDSGVQMVLSEASREDLTAALKTASEEVKEKIFSNLSLRAARMLKEDLESLGPTRLSVVEKAQQKIVELFKSFESRGKIAIGAASADQLV